MMMWGRRVEVGKAVERRMQRQAGYELYPSASDMNAEDVNASSAP